MKYYTGLIGTNEISNVFKLIIRETAKISAENKYTLRTSYKKHTSELFIEGCDVAYGEKQTHGDFLSKGAYDIAQYHYPKWEYAKPEKKRQLAAIASSILGNRLNKPSEYILVYSPDDYNEEIKTAYRIAKDYRIDFFNLFDYSSIYLMRELFS